MDGDDQDDRWVSVREADESVERDMTGNRSPRRLRARTGGDQPSGSARRKKEKRDVAEAKTKRPGKKKEKKRQGGFISKKYRYYIMVWPTEHDTSKEHTYG
jgi:hypothetical protein